MTGNIVGVVDIIKACNRIREHLTSALSLYFGIVRHCEESTNIMSTIRWQLRVYVGTCFSFKYVCTYVCMYVCMTGSSYNTRLTRYVYPLPVGSRKDRLVVS